MEFEINSQSQFIVEEKVFNVIPESTTTKFDTKVFYADEAETFMLND